MILPTVTVRKFIVAANLDWVDPDNIVVGNLPADVDDSVTSILIRDASSGLSRHADNAPHALNARVEIQIFFKKNLDINPLDCKLQIMNLAIRSGWLLDDDRPFTSDPDTQQITATFFVNKKFILDL